MYIYWATGKTTKSTMWQQHWARGKTTTAKWQQHWATGKTTATTTITWQQHLAIGKQQHQNKNKIAKEKSFIFSGCKLAFHCSNNHRCLFFVNTVISEHASFSCLWQVSALTSTMSKYLAIADSFYVLLYLFCTVFVFAFLFCYCCFFCLDSFLQ